MCGICGFVGLDDDALVARMCDTMRHRGPDDVGFFTDRGVALGIRRLSIIDIATGHQPIPNEDETLWIVLNGEIFNYRQLRAELQAEGHRFRTTSDTEVILHLYERMGDRCVERLCGMFAFAIWDSRDRTLVLARDRVGIKPLYYAQRGRQFAFASEIKALLLCPFVRREMNLDALPDYLTLQYVPSPNTMFAGVLKLPAGHTLRLRDGKPHIERYWQVRFDAAGGHRDEGDVLDEFEDRVAGAVRSQLVSDVPLGALLSGGIDSSVVVAIMARAMDRPVQTFTVAFEPGAGYTEVRHAWTVAKALRTDHREMTARPAAAQLLPSLVWHLDEPIADAAALPMFLISRFAKQRVTVSLTGEGGDEFYGGYPRYFLFRWAKTLERVPRVVRENFLRAATRAVPMSPLTRRTISRLLTSGSDAERHLGWVANFTPDQVSRLMRGDPAAQRPLEFVADALATAKGDDLVHRLMHLDATTWLVDDILTKVDKVTMATALEARVPLLDHVLLEFVMSLPSSLKVRGTTTKVLLRKLAKRFLPPQIAARPKHAFLVPLDAWFRGDLRRMAENTFLAPDARIAQYLDAEAIHELADMHFAGTRHHGQRLWNLLCLELWHRIFIDQSLSPVPATEAAASLAASEWPRAGHPVRRLRACVSTHNPNDAGGVRTLARAMSRILTDQGYDVRILWPSHRLGRAAWGEAEHPFEGAECIELPSVPQLETLRYTVPALFGGRFAQDADIYQAVCGPNLPSLPFALWGKRYVCWVATTLREERRSQMLGLDWSRDSWYLRANQPLFPLARRLEAYACRSAAMVLALSSYTARAVEEEYGVPKHSIRIIPSPVDTVRFNEQVEPLRPVGGPFLLVVARAEDPRKNLPMLLRAFSLVRKEFPELQLVVVGRKPKTSHLLELARSLGVAEAFHLLGHVPDEDVPRICRAAEAYALSSLQEGLGIAPMEAMACGTPVIATRCGGPEDFVLDGRTGLMVPNDDPEAFAAAAIRLLRDDALRARLGRDGAAHIRERFSFEAVGRQFAQVYREVYPELFG
jgi:asparagine synthase (glutamine-hydrolysing)